MSSGILEVDKIARQNLGARRCGGGRCKGRWVEGREKGGFRRTWGNGMGGMEEGWIWEQGSKYLN